MNIRSKLAASAAILISVSAHADDAVSPDAETAQLETVVVEGRKPETPASVGTKSDLPVEQFPQSVELIGADDVVELGARSAGDLLKGVASANIGNSRIASYQSFSLKVRGFLADQMRNGIRQRYFEDVDASALSNIETAAVLKGPSAVLYGQSAVGGLINYVTKRPQPSFAAEAAATFGRFDQQVYTVDLTGPLTPTLAVRLTGEIERSGTFVDLQDMDRDNAALTFMWSPSENLSAFLLAEWQKRNTVRHPGLPVSGTVISNGVRDLSRGLFLGEPKFSDLQAYAPLFQFWMDYKLNDHWTLTPRLQHSGFDSDFEQVRLRGAEADGVTINRNGRQGSEDDRYQIAQIDLQGTFTTGPLAHTLLLGVERARERSTFLQFNLSDIGPINAIDPVYQYDTAAPTLEFSFDGDFDVDSTAVYAQDVIDLTAALNLIAGVRYTDLKVHDVFNGEVTETKPTSTTWQLGSTYRMAGGWSVYGGYSTGYDIEGTGSSRNANGEAFDPEESDQIEVGLRFRPSTRIHASLSLFQVRRKNLLTTDLANPDFSVQSGEVRVRGVELEGDLALSSNWTLSGGYAYLDSELTDTTEGKELPTDRGFEGNRLEDTPRHSANLFTRYVLPFAPLDLRAGINYVGRRDLTNANDIQLDAYTTVDFGAGYSWNQLRVDAYLVNAFDERYFTADSATTVFPGDPRTFSVRVGYRF